MSWYGSIWDKIINSSKFLEGLFEEICSILFFTHMTYNSKSLYSFGFQFLNSLINMRYIPTRNHNSTSLLSKTGYNSFSNSCWGSRNNSYFAFHWVITFIRYLSKIINFLLSIISSVTLHININKINFKEVIKFLLL